jgi:hypothetical protein
VNEQSLHAHATTATWRRKLESEMQIFDKEMSLYVVKGEGGVPRRCAGRPQRATPQMDLPCLANVQTGLEL